MFIVSRYAIGDDKQKKLPDTHQHIGEFYLKPL